MNRIFLIGAIFLAATFIITNTPNVTMAYSCSSSSSTYNINSQTGVSGSSGGCSSSSSAGTSSTQAGSLSSTAIGPNGQTFLGATSFFGGFQGAGSSSVGGGQSSCSSTSVTTSGGVTLTTTSVSKSGTCP